MTRIPQQATGWVPGLSNENYHRGPGYGSTDMKLANLSPAHLKAKELFETTDPLRQGSGLHHWMFEQDSFYDHFLVIEEGKSRPGNFKNKEKETGRTILTYKMYEEILQWADAVMEDEDARRIYEMEDAVMECSGYWRHHSGLLLKIRPDIRSPKLGAIVDLKSLVLKDRIDLHNKFNTRIAELKYHLSAKLYLDVANEIEVKNGTGIVYDHYIWLIVTKEPPYLVGLSYPSNEMLYQGTILIDRAVSRIQDCEASGEWPKPKIGYQVAELPEWYKKQNLEVYYE